MFIKRSNISKNNNIYINNYDDDSNDPQINVIAPFNTTSENSNISNIALNSNNLNKISHITSDNKSNISSLNKLSFIDSSLTNDNRILIKNVHEKLNDVIFVNHDIDNDSNCHINFDESNIDLNNNIVSTSNNYPEDHIDIINVDTVINFNSQIKNQVSELSNKSDYLTRLIDDNQKCRLQNESTISDLDSQCNKIENDLSKYYRILDVIRSFGSLVSSKSLIITNYINDLLNYKIDVIECTYRMRRWLICDLIVFDGYNDIDFNCTNLEDIDEYGQNVSDKIKSTYYSRIDKYNHILNEICDYNLNINTDIEFNKNINIDCKYINDILNSLIHCYDYTTLSKHFNYGNFIEYDCKNLIDDISDDYKTIDYILSEFVMSDYIDFNKLIGVFIFYSNMSLLTWDPLDNTHLRLHELDWYIACNKNCPKLLPIVIQEVIHPFCLKTIEVWDMESFNQSLLLSDFLKTICIHIKSHDTIIEKLIKIIEDRLSVLSFKIRHDNIVNNKINSFLKYHYMNIMVNILKLSDILSLNTLGKLVIDSLFIKYVIPLLKHGSRQDGLIVLIYKSIIYENIPKYMDIKIKNNSIAKSIFNRFIDEHDNYYINDLL